MIRPLEYTNDPDYSQSDLKVFERNINEFHRMYILGEGRPDFESRSTDIGNVVDALSDITKANPLEDYDIEEHVAISDALKEVIREANRRIVTHIEPMKQTGGYSEARKKLLESGPEPAKSFLMQAADVLNYRKSQRWGADAIWNEVSTKGLHYFNVLGKLTGKPIIDGKLYRIARVTMDSMIKDPVTGPLFTKREKVKSVYQMIAKFKIHGIGIKCLLDIVEAIKPSERVNIFPYDVKTAASHAQFMASYHELRYGHQGSMYSKALTVKYPNAIVQPFKFVVGITTLNAEGTAPKEPPRIYEMTEDEIKLNWHGGTTMRGKVIRGANKLIQDLAWHKENGKWDHPRAYYENNNRFYLDSNKDISALTGGDLETLD